MYSSVFPVLGRPKVRLPANLLGACLLKRVNKMRLVALRLYAGLSLVRATFAGVVSPCYCLRSCISWSMQVEARKFSVVRGWDPRTDGLRPPALVDVGPQVDDQFVSFS